MPKDKEAQEDWKVGDKVYLKAGHPYIFFGNCGEEGEGVVVERQHGTRGRVSVLCPNGQILGFDPEELDTHDRLIISKLNQTPSEQDAAFQTAYSRLAREIEMSGIDLKMGDS